jgi:periplasmic divalent cation tolerance protein
LVEQRLAACVSILPAVESVYRWQEKIESANEALLLIKTTSERFPALRQKILELHSYDTPEIIALPIVAGLEKYLHWLEEQVSLPDR